MSPLKCGGFAAEIEELSGCCSSDSCQRQSIQRYLDYLSSVNEIVGEGEKFVASFETTNASGNIFHSAVHSLVAECRPVCLPISVGSNLICFTFIFWTRQSKIYTKSKRRKSYENEKKNFFKNNLVKIKQDESREFVRVT